MTGFYAFHEPPARVLEAAQARAKEALDDALLSEEEERSFRREALRSRAGWVEHGTRDPVTKEPAPGTFWVHPGIAYRVVFTAHKTRWRVDDPPFRVESPEGTLLAGSNHLATAQKTAGRFWQPIEVPEPVAEESQP